MDRFVRRGSNGANSIRLGTGAADAIIAFKFRANDIALALVTSTTAVDQGDVGGKAHSVDMSAGVQVVQGVADERERFEERDGEARILNVGHHGQHVDIRDHGTNRGCRFGCLGLADVMAAEKELAVEIGEVDGVQIDHGDGTETNGSEVFHQFASDAARADHQETCISYFLLCARAVYSIKGRA